jgi:molecular chaperone GrpE
MIDHSHPHRMRRTAGGLWVPEGRTAGRKDRGGDLAHGDPEDPRAAETMPEDEQGPGPESSRDRDGESGQAATAPSAADEAREYKESWMRALADFENFRRRAARETSEARDRGRAEVLTSLLAVLDDVDRALEHAGAGAEAASADPILTGVQLMRTHLDQVLRAHGVEEIPALAEPFDPHVHEAVMQIPSQEIPPGDVAQVLRRGYRMGDRVLRPARVAVARQPDE